MSPTTTSVPTFYTYRNANEILAPATGLIAFKLWSVERRVYGSKDNRYLTKVAITIIESGALYSAFLISLLVTYVNNEWSLYVPFFLVSDIYYRMGLR